MYKQKKDKTMRNKVTIVVLSCYIIGFALTVLTKTPVFALTTALSVPVCLTTPIKNWIKS